MKIKVGLMLGGGGAKGAFQLGVIKALEEANLLKYIKVISGTSIGAINTLLLMSKKNHDKMSEIWEELENSNVFSTKAHITKDDRLYSLDPLVQTLSQKISVKAIKRSKYKGYATASKLYSKTSLIHQLKTNTMEKEVFALKQFENPYEAVLASASIPVVFGPTKINDASYVDGGMLDNYPIEPLLEEKCNLILAVALDSKFNPFVYDHLDINIVDFTSRSAFETNIIKDLIESVGFVEEKKDEKEYLGYIVGQVMIQKLYKEGIIKKVLWFKKLNKYDHFKVIQLNQDEEEFIKHIKTANRFKEIKRRKRRRGRNNDAI